jgi:hypothetical protein
MKYLTAIALACLLATPASAATATPTLKVGRCLLKVDGLDQDVGGDGRSLPRFA